MDLLVEEHPGADDKLEDVLQGLHGFQQLLCQLLCVVYVVLQDLGQFPTHAQSHIHTENLSNQLFTSLDEGGGSCGPARFSLPTHV